MNKSVEEDFATNFKNIGNKSSAHMKMMEHRSDKFEDLIKGVSAATDSIERTKQRLLRQASDDPALHLILYKADSNNNKTLRKWADMLQRLSIAQHIILTKLRGKVLSEEEIYELYPKIPKITISHVIEALKLALSDEVVYSREIIEQLQTDPERYQRLEKWTMTIVEYLKMCMKGFLNCHLTLSSNAFRIRNQMKMFIVQDVNGNYGLYTESEGGVNGITNELKYLDVDLENKTRVEIKEILDKLTILGPRESMYWFINEGMDCLMFSFEWKECINYAHWVYNTLCRI
jgi:hypothetical protein